MTLYNWKRRSKMSIRYQSSSPEKDGRVIYTVGMVLLDVSDKGYEAEALTSEAAVVYRRLKLPR